METNANVSNTHVVSDFVHVVSSSFFTWLNDDVLPVIFFIVYIGFFLVGVGINILLLIVTIRAQLHKNSVQAFVIQMAVVDLIASVFIVAPTVGSAAKEEFALLEVGFACKMQAVLFTWCLLLTFTFLVIGALERLVRILDGDKHLSTFGNVCFVRLVSVLVWICGLGISLLILTVESEDIDYDKDQFLCSLDYRSNPTMTQVIFALVIYIPLIVYITSYAVIFCNRGWKTVKEDRERKRQLHQRVLSAIEGGKENTTGQLRFKEAACKESQPENTQNQTLYRDSSNTNQPQDGGSSEKTVLNEIQDRTKTSVFFLEYSPTKPLNRSNARVGILPPIPNPPKIPEQVTNKNEVIPLPAKTVLKPIVSPKDEKHSYTFRLKQKLTAQGSWKRTIVRVRQRHSVLTIFHDKPNDVDHHLAMTYLITWCLMMSCWLLFFVTALSHAYGPRYGSSFRVGVFLGLFSYCLKPFIYVAHNRWYRKSCWNEVKVICPCRRSTDSEGAQAPDIENSPATCEGGNKHLN